MAIEITKHSEYIENQSSWEKFRIVFKGGSEFKNRYLKRYSARESDEEFEARFAMSYTPAHAKTAITEVHNSIFQRMPDVTREGGSEFFRAVVSGELGGVDQKGSSMTKFIDRDCLLDLLVLGKVGVFVDRDQFFIETLSDAKSTTPYIYMVKAENIFDWKYDYYRGIGAFTMVLLQDYDEETKDKFYRKFVLEEGKVVYYELDESGEDRKPPLRSNLEEIPFAIAQLSSSLMEDIADYQIGCLNLASSDMSIAWRGNFPIWTEQRNTKTGAPAQKSTTEAEAVGPMIGRSYPKDSERPQFVSPSPDPLRVSMEKQQRMADEIRETVGLTISSITGSSSNVSADAREFESRSLEAGLASIGLELETLENRINRLWANYEGGEPAKTKYPSDYSLKTNSQRLDEADSWAKKYDTAPSSTFRKQISKQIVRILFQGRTSTEILENMYSEIDNSKIPDVRIATIKEYIELKMLSRETAGEATGLPLDEFKKALEENDRVAAATVKAQQAASKGVLNSENAPPQGDENDNPTS